MIWYLMAGLGLLSDEDESMTIADATAMCLQQMVEEIEFLDLDGIDSDRGRYFVESLPSVLQGLDVLIYPGHPSHCFMCGTGEVVDTIAAGRVLTIEGVEVELPADFQIPTCSNELCGAVWYDQQVAARLSALHHREMGAEAA